MKPGIQEQPKWVRAAISGDETALAWLLEKITHVVQSRATRALLRYSAKSSGRSIRQEVEDLTQEIFLWLFEKEGKVLKSWNPDQGVPLAGFIGFVADRKAMGIMRNKKRSPWTEEPTIAEELEQRQDPIQNTSPLGAAVSQENTKDPEHQIASKELIQLVIDRLNESLSPLGRYLFSLMYVEQQSVDEVSQHLGMTADAVYAWRSRLGRKSREILNQILAKEETLGYRLVGGS